MSKITKQILVVRVFVVAQLVEIRCLKSQPLQNVLMHTVERTKVKKEGWLKSRLKASKQINL